MIRRVLGATRPTGASVSRLFVGNFDFEHRLSGVRGGTDPALARLQRELSAAWIAVADEGDAIVLPEPIEPGFLEEAVAAGLPRIEFVPGVDGCGDRELVPWGWTSETLELAWRHGLAAAAPPIDAVRVSNSRRTSFALESRWGVGAPGATECASMSDLEGAIRDRRVTERWVVKGEFGMSGREQLRGRGPELAPAHSRWIERRLQTGPVYFEPWLERIDEAGVQLTVPRSGPVRLEGVAPLLSDARGQYAGSRFDPDPRIERDYAEAIEVARRAACRLQELGYFGPLGIDAMRYRDEGGNVRVRPLQDINARWTMGRMSLGLRRLLRPGEAGVWRHVRWGLDGEPRKWMIELAGGLRAARVVRTSPFELGGTPTRLGTVAVLTPALEAARDDK